MGQGRAIILVLLLISSTTFSREIILECGTATDAGFNGWSISPYDSFSDVEFTDETVAFYVENGGEYTLYLTRKISAMKEISELEFSLRFDRLENCFLNYVDVLVSSDGRSWKSLEVDQLNLSGVIENADGYEYIRIAANVSFFKNGFIECSYFRLSADDQLKLESDEGLDPIIVKEFFIFCFNKSINVETQNELPYEVVFSNLAGQVVYRESSVGSTRVLSDLPDGVYLISIIQNDTVVETKKVIF